ncbi:MAG TPA: glycerophosphodiester phosphodiesterase family protein [Syntrophobacteria bacterium]|nr:glycerophosphodiester phosphodiesterase family protein [Syntrophobacteria bacterium]
MSTPTTSWPLIIAHRGARSLAPENTLAAARKALEVGADMWELDVGMTADGELLVIHDNTLTRTSNVKQIFPERRPWLLAQFTLDEIRRLDCGTWFTEKDPFGQIAAGAVPPGEVASYRGEPAPTLRETLAFTRDHNWRVNVEIKDLRHTPGASQVVPKVLALLEELDIADRVLVSSFRHTYLREIRRRNPRIATGALVKKPHADPKSLLQRLGAQAYHPSLAALRRDEISRLRTRGFQVNVWTVNEPEVMRSLMGAGVSGIFTDFPQVMRPLVTERK